MINDDVYFSVMEEDQEIDGIGLHLTPEVGNPNDGVTHAKIVFDRKDDSTIFAHILRHDEPIPEKKVKVPRGFVLKISGLKYLCSLDGLDKYLSNIASDGYRTTTEAIFTYLYLNGVSDENVQRYFLAASRRLDASHRLISAIREDLHNQKTEQNFYKMRRMTFEIIGEIEIAVISVNRSLQMITQIPKEFKVSKKYSNFLKRQSQIIKNIRNGYEHIEERAKGKIHGKIHKDALAVFNQEELFKNGMIKVGKNQLDINKTLTQIFIEARQYLKETSVVVL